MTIRLGVVALALLAACGTPSEGPIKTTADTIVVSGSSYRLQIAKATGTATLASPSGARYTEFPLFAEVLPRTGSDPAAKLSWEVGARNLKMTAADPSTGKILCTAEIRCDDDAFEIRFGVRPPRVDFGYTVSVVNGSWPWGLGLDTAFPRTPITLGGRQFPKGLGAHAIERESIQGLKGPARITYAFREPPGGRFEALVGVDDGVGAAGSVAFEVWADGKKVAESGLLKGGAQPKTLTADLGGARKVELVVTDGGDGEGGDQADWADARFVTSKGETLYASDLIRAQQEGVRLLGRGGQGMDGTGWTETFTPEPDVYAKNPPLMVDVRQDEDGNRFYAPAPLELSFRAAAGWFSVGLAELPDATGLRFEDGRLSIPYAWSKMVLDRDELYPVSPLCFTFNDSEWDAISDYREYLLRHGYARDIPIEQKNIPDWWMRPLICTWSEQCLTGAEQGKPKFTPEWVERYVDGQQKALGIDKFTVILDDRWQRAYGDPRPDPVRFAGIRKMVDRLHARGFKILLWWRCWYAEPGSMPDEMGLLDGRYIDATHPRFEEYVRRSMEIMLGSGPDGLDADGFKVDYIFDVRNPATAKYARPSLGIGIREVYRSAELWYREAKKVKPDCLVTFSGPDPHFALIQDMTRINDAGRDPRQRPMRARVNALSAPNLLLDGDEADICIGQADFHHVVSAAYAVPSLYSLSRYQDGPITNDMHRVTGTILRLASMKKPGRAVFRDHGQWEMERDGKVVAECLQDATVFVVRPDAQRLLLVSTRQQAVTVPLRGSVARTVRTEQGKEIRFEVADGELLIIPDAVRGEVYVVEFE